MPSQVIEGKSALPALAVDTTELTIFACGAIDLAPVAQLKKLERLFLLGSSVTDVSPLARCSSLRHLEINYCPVEDLSALKALDLRDLRCFGLPLDAKSRALLVDGKLAAFTAAPPESEWKIGLDLKKRKSSLCFGAIPGRSTLLVKP